MGRPIGPTVNAHVATDPSGGSAGSTATANGERKHLTIMFADLVGSTPMGERLDPEDVHRLTDTWLRMMTEEVYRHGGIINQFSGDSIMALFGAPVAYEDAAQRACRAALAMQRRLLALGAEGQPRLRMRVGIDTGEAFVGTLGSDLRTEYAALGHRSNRAKRVQEAAEAGGVTVSEETYRLAEPYFVFTPGGAFRAKGISEPLTLYRLVGPRRPRSRLDATLSRWHVPLVGRTAELSRLGRALDEIAGGRPQLVLIEGEPGVGKSRLALELKRLAAARAIPVWEGRAVAYGERSYGVFADCLRRLCQIGEDDTAELMRRKTAALAAPLGSDARFLEAVLSADASNGPLRHLDPEAMKAGIFAAVRRLVCAQAARGPIVLILDDFHWADQLSRELSEALIEASVDVPLLLCAVARPGGITLRLLDRFSRLQLPALSAEETSRLIGGLVTLTREQSGHTISRWAHELSGGNPLFVEEAVQALLSEGMLVPDDGGWRLAGDLRRASIPGTLHDLVASRIDRLADDEKATLQQAAVIGDQFGVAILRGLTGRDDLAPILAEITRQEFIAEAEPGAEDAYRFKHGVTWQVAYQTLALSRRAELHGRAAALLEWLHADNLEPHLGRLAYHYGRSPHAAKAVSVLRSAGEQAVRAYANEDARSYFTQALEKGEDILKPAERAELLLARAEVRSKLLDHAGAVADFDGAVAAAGDGRDARLAARALLGKGNSFAHQYRFDEALLCFDQALAAARAGDCREEEIEVLLRQGLVLGEKETRETAAALASLQRALQMSRELRNARLEIEALIHLATLYYNRYESGAALRTLEECVTRCVDVDDRAALSLALLNQGRAYLAQGACEQAIDVNRRLYQLLLEIGDGRRLAHCVSNLGLAWQVLGEERDDPACFEQARACYEDALARFRSLGSTSLTRMTLLMLRGLYVKLGRVDKQIDTLAELIPLLRAEGAGEQTAEMLVEMGEACTRQDDAAHASACFTEAAKFYLDSGNHGRVRACLTWLEQLKAGGVPGRTR